MNISLDDIFSHVRGAWRYRKIAALTAWVVCFAGWGFVLMMPDRYEASARVFVDTRTALGEVTQDIALSSNVEMQIQRVRQALLGGPQLEKVAREADVQLEGATPQQRERLMNSLRDRIRLTGNPPREGSRDQSAGLYTISYSDRSRDQALRVVDRLVSAFVESTLGGKREGSETAQRFLREQIAEYERRLSAAEQRLAAFKKENVGLMPGAQGDYFSRLQAEMDALNKAQSALSIAQSRRVELGRQLRGEAPVVSGGGSGGGGASAAGGNNDTASRIRESQTRLDELLLRFTDKHPDVIALRQTILDLQARLQEEVSAVKRGDPGAAARFGLNASPVFQNIQLQMNQTEVEVAALRGEIGNHQARIASLQKLVNTAPEVEAEFARLNRDYDVTRAQYQSLVGQLERTRLAEEADATGVVKFEVIDPPSASFTPASPKRKQLILAVLFAGFAAAGGVAFLLHQWKPVFSNVRQLAELSGLPVLGAVSMTWRERHRARDRRQLIGYAGQGAALVLVAFVIVKSVDELTRLVQ